MTKILSAKKVIPLLLFTLMLIGLVKIGQSFFQQLACEGQPINDNVAPTEAQQIQGAVIIGQSFIAPRPDLNQIDILFQTYQRRNNQDVTLRLLDVSESPLTPLQGQDVRQITFNAAIVRDQSWQTFTFPPIANAKGKTYFILLQSPASSDGDAISVGGIERNVYLPGLAFAGGTPLSADIAFRTCYQMTSLEKLQVLSSQLTRNRPAMWGNTLFYGLLFILYGLLLIGFFWTLSRLRL